ncbi:membrane dipeptidase [Sphingobium sp. JAI105]|uniref:dipeptidase n=1 Tax=Sphingobium sp. JAI105 TaxID=2787715 RepID=UPI0018C9C3C4|nr:membrane dipeptidase [Sphingobium sp. JAI105]MBG6118456.1 membrane dipeptidase [Sphingobium sp. JAI105]
MSDISDPIVSDALTVISPEAERILGDALVWDGHGGFTSKPDQDLNELDRWERSKVDFLSINVGFDIHPWEFAVRTIATYRRWIADRPERFVLVETAACVRRAKAEGKMAIAFDLEGAVPLGDQLSMLTLYRRLGVRQMHFVYNVNNSAGGGCQDDDTGLTPYGHDLVRECNRLGVIVDLSHTGYRTTMDMIAASSQPVIFSHSNPKAHTDHPRNITLDQMRACAAAGGLVGVTGVGRFLGDPLATSESFVRAIDIAVESIGIAAVGMGIDYTWAPGSYARSPASWPAEHYTGKFAYMSPEQLPEITELLLRRGYTESDIQAVYGENYLRVATQVWGAEQAAS